MVQPQGGVLYGPLPFLSLRAGKGVFPKGSRQQPLPARTASVSRPLRAPFLPFSFFFFRHAAPSFLPFSFPFLSRSTLFLLPLCLLFSFALARPATLPFRTSSDFRFRSFLPVSSLFSCPSRLSFLPCFLPALPFYLPPFPPFPSLFRACSASVSCSPGPCFPSASPHSSASPFSPPLSAPFCPLCPFFRTASPHSSASPFSPPPSAPFCPLCPFFRSASPHFLPRAGGGLSARLTIGNKIPAIAFLFC